MTEWIDDLADVLAAGEPVVIVTVAAIRGSAPREAGAKMLVTRDETIGTIGGGQLEYQCTRIAVDMLGANELPSVRNFPLGASMGQCCGGVVDVLFEPLDAAGPGWLADLRALHGQRRPLAMLTGIGASAGKFIVAAELETGPGELPHAIRERAFDMLSGNGGTERVGDYVIETVVNPDFNIAVFGAGHVGAAVVPLLARLDSNIRWIDSRRNIFRTLPSNVRAIEAAEPALEVAAMPPGSFYLVMTHSHAIDYEIVSRILVRNDAAYCGLIGSVSKRRRFEKRFRAQGIGDAQIEKLTCPIGVDGISGKKPAEIAVAVAAELLQARDRVAQQSRGELPDNVRPLKR